MLYTILRYIYRVDWQTLLTLKDDTLQQVSPHGFTFLADS